MVHQLSVGIGVASAALLLSASASFRGGPGARPEMIDFRVALAAMALVALVSMWRFIFLDPAAGSEVSGHNAVTKARGDSQRA